jgi:hypothetical protein
MPASAPALRERFIGAVQHDVPRANDRCAANETNG